jgi:hypothetical protein
MKKILKIFIVVLICLSVIVILKDQIIKSVVSIAATKITGAKVEIGGFSLGILTQSVRIRDFKMYNPAGFPSGTIIDLPKVVVSCDLLSLLKGKLHLPLVEVELKELGLVKNTQGKLNVDALKVSQQQEPRKAQEKRPSKPLAMQIDQLNLQMGRIVSKDYTVGKEPAVQVYDINFKKSYQNITSAQQLAVLILAESMKQAGIKGAAIYGVSVLAGLAVFPAAIAATFIGKDSMQQNLKVAASSLYDTSLSVLKRIGKIIKEDKPAVVIAAEVNGARVTVKLKQVSASSTQITISARKLGLPKPETASGVFYQISQEIKK